MNTGTRLTQYMFRYKNGKLLAILPVVHGGYVDGTYYVIGDNFIGYKNSIYLEAGNTKIGTNNKIFAEFRLQDGKYRYHQLLKDTLPAENLKYGFYYHATDFKKEFPYYMMMTATSIRNILTGKEYNLSHLYTTIIDNQTSLTAKMLKHIAFDFKIDKSFIAYLTILDDEHFYYVRYDLEHNTVIERKKLWNLGPARSYPSLDNWDYNYIFYWEKSYIIRQKM